MSRISELINNNKHRPWPLTLPGSWRFYQEWTDALFMHWKIDPAVIQVLLPAGLDVDIIDGNTWASVVAFTMRNSRPRNLPSLSVVSDFHEINLRVYVIKDNKPGVYFLTLEAEKLMSAFIARSVSGLPYEKAQIKKTRQQNTMSYLSVNNARSFKLDVSYKIDESAYKTTLLDKWLIERYCLYQEQGGQLYRLNIHHGEWPVSQIHLNRLELEYKFGGLLIKERKPDLVQFSEGVKVLTWGREKV